MAKSKTLKHRNPVAKQLRRLGAATHRNKKAYTRKRKHKHERMP